MQIELKGVWTHNLKGLDINFPLNRFTVVTGPSGAGKSSLVFDSLYGEARRRYLQSLSFQARQFIKGSPSPQIASAENLPPAIAVRQSRYGGGRRSTVGTLSEISDLLQIFFSHLGKIHCPTCQTHLEAQDGLSLFNRYAKAQEAMILAPLEGLRHLDRVYLFDQLVSQGFTRLYQDETMLRIDDTSSQKLSGSLEHLFVIVDRIGEVEKNRDRFIESTTTAFRLGQGFAAIKRPDSLTQRYADGLYCQNCKRAYQAPTPFCFSANHPLGACSSCQGLGDIQGKVCPVCQGNRLNPFALSVLLTKKNIYAWQEQNIDELFLAVTNLEQSLLAEIEKKESGLAQALAEAFSECQAKLRGLQNIGLGYLSCSRRADSLSGGELQRIHLARALASELSDSLYCLDEPSAGLHPQDSEAMLKMIKTLKSFGNTVVAVEHDPMLIAQADNIIEIGPAAGHLGGQLMYSGELEPWLKNNELKKFHGFAKPTMDFTRAQKANFLELEDCRIHNLKIERVALPLGAFTLVCGVSGSGKSSLVHHTIFPLLQGFLTGQAPAQILGHFGSSSQHASLDAVEIMDQRSAKRNSRSNLASYLGIYDSIRKVFAKLPLAKEMKLNPNDFSFNSSEGGRCTICKGLGYLLEDLSFLGEVALNCPDCNGQRFQERILSVRYREKNIAQVLEMTALEAHQLFYTETKIAKALVAVLDLGLGYLPLGQSFASLSGGEIQRLKLLSVLGPVDDKKSCLMIFDEPSSGLSDKELDLLLTLFRKICAKGHTVLVVDHNLHLIKSADYLIEMGPKASHLGGRVLYQGPAAGILQCPESVTARFLI